MNTKFISVATLFAAGAVLGGAPTLGARSLDLGTSPATLTTAGCGSKDAPGGCGTKDAKAGDKTKHDAKAKDGKCGPKKDGHCGKDGKGNMDKKEAPPVEKK
jgi:uncharacterized low-complexity protein